MVLFTSTCSSTFSSSLNLIFSILSINSLFITLIPSPNTLIPSAITPIIFSSNNPTLSPCPSVTPATLSSIPTTLSSNFSTTLTHPTSFLFTGTTTNLLTKHHTPPTQRPAWHSSPTLSLPHFLTNTVDDLCPYFILFSLSHSFTNHHPLSQLTKLASFNFTSTLSILSSHLTPLT
ncbi:hypothetical protein L873DRAFT_543205 [Choiromyces venosus 120613-1]|uniref:Uncharacterized protein n=1 Tax=Choiromyces venosus 120613-1 TaxID=1336337 RepID=A0A3N4K8J3_9PEZI|nr:hypothetical protein L873DRAFT_543205 [Choiromyces venosus 120613-1]